MKIVDWVFAKLEQMIDPVDGVVLGPRPPTPVSVSEPSIREDRDAPNLFVGKVLDDRNIKCEVVSCTEEYFRIKILEIRWVRLGTYMDLGCIYPLKLCYDSGDGEMMVWEIDPDTMKRSTSQVLLAWEKDLGWTWDLDM